MSKRQFSDPERYAVYTVHGEKCYMCGEPIDLFSMEVDHVIPESLLDDLPALQKVLNDYGLPKDFDIQSFANWMPACKGCNNRKRSRLFKPTPRIQLEIQIASEKAPKAAALAEARVSKQTVSKAWNTLKRAAANGEMSEQIQKEIQEFSAFHAGMREPEMVNEPMHLTPFIEVLSEGNGIRIVKGPYGVGGGPIGPHVAPEARCPSCGNAAWNGARCVVCGEMSDD